MLSNFIVVANQVLVLCVLMALGFICNKVHWLDFKAVKGMTNVLLYLVTPCVIVNSFAREMEPDLLKGLGITAIIAFATFILSIFFVHYTVRDEDKSREVVYKFGAIFGNCGFMALPLEYAVLGDIGTFYGAVYVAVFNLIAWTYGVWLMSGDKKCVKPKALLTNPGILGVVFGVLIFVFQIKLPTVIGTSIGYIADLNTPLPMIVIGYYLGNVKLKNFTDDVKQYFVAFIKLLLIPGIFIQVAYWLHIDPTITVVCTIAAAAPTAANTAMFATLYDRDAELGAQLLSITTVLSIATLPILVALAQTIV